MKVYLYCLGGPSYGADYPEPVPPARTWAECYRYARRFWAGRGEDGATPCADGVAFACYLGQPWDGRGEPDAILSSGPRGGVVRERC